MKPRAHWLARFMSWFFNTSPEWVAPDETKRRAADPRQIQQSEPAPRDAPPSDDAAKPDRPPS